MDRLPEELMICIIERVPSICAFGRAACVNREWRRLCRVAEERVYIRHSQLVTKELEDGIERRTWVMCNGFKHRVLYVRGEQVLVEKLYRAGVRLLDVEHTLQSDEYVKTHQLDGQEQLKSTTFYRAVLQLLLHPKGEDEEYNALLAMAVYPNRYANAHKLANALDHAYSYAEGRGEEEAVMARMQALVVEWMASGTRTESEVKAIKEAVREETWRSWVEEMDAGSIVRRVQRVTLGQCLKYVQEATQSAQERGLLPVELLRVTPDMVTIEAIEQYKRLSDVPVAVLLAQCLYKSLHIYLTSTGGKFIAHAPKFAKIGELISSFNETMECFLAEVTQYTDAIDVMRCLVNIHLVRLLAFSICNFELAFCMSAALNNSSIYRIYSRKVVIEMFPLMKEGEQLMNDLLSSDGNFKHLRILHDSADGSIPYAGPTLNDLTFICESNTPHVERKLGAKLISLQHLYRMGQAAKPDRWQTERLAEKLLDCPEVEISEEASAKIQERISQMFSDQAEDAESKAYSWSLRVFRRVSRHMSSVPSVFSFTSLFSCDNVVGITDAMLYWNTMAKIACYKILLAPLVCRSPKQWISFLPFDPLDEASERTVFMELIHLAMWLQICPEDMIAYDDVRQRISSRLQQIVEHGDVTNAYAAASLQQELLAVQKAKLYQPPPLQSILHKAKLYDVGDPEIPLRMLSSESFKVMNNVSVRGLMAYSLGINQEHYQAQVESIEWLREFQRTVPQMFEYEAESIEQAEKNTCNKEKINYVFFSESKSYHNCSPLKGAYKEHMGDTGTVDDFIQLWKQAHEEQNLVLHDGEAHVQKSWAEPLYLNVAEWMSYSSKSEH